MNRLLRAGTWVFAGTLLGRFAGFAREVVLAGRVGASTEADVAIVLLTLPDLVLNILIGGAFGAALIPEFTRLGGAAARSLMVRSTLAVLGVTALGSTLLALFARQFVQMLGPGIAPGLTSNAVGQARILLISIPFSAVTAVIGAYLQAARRFAIPALGTLAYNLVLVIALVAMASPLMGISIGVVAGSLLRLTMHAGRARYTLLEPSTAVTSTEPRRILLRYAEALAAGSVLLAYPIVARTLASLGDRGAVAVINYGSKLVELPNGVALTLFAVVLFPTMARAIADQRESDAQATARRGLRMIVWLAVPLAVGLGAFGADLAVVALMRGKLDASAAQRIGAVTSWWAFALPAQGVSSILIALLNAKSDTRSPLLASLAGLVVLVALSLSLRGPLGPYAVVLGVVAAYWTVLVIQAIALRRHGHDLFGRTVYAQGLRMLFVTTLCFAPFVILARTLHSLHAAHRLAFGCVAGVVALAVGSGILGEDRAWLVQRLRRSSS